MTKQLKFLFVAFLLLTAGAIAHTVQADTINSTSSGVSNWTDWGTIKWGIDSNGTLWIKPQSGSTGSIGDASGEISDKISDSNSESTSDNIIEKNTVPWFSRASDIKSVRLEGTITGFNMNYLFAGLSNCSDIDLTNLKVDSTYSLQAMFAKDTSLEKITGLEKFNTSQVINMHGVFNGCSNLTNLDISNWDTSNVTSMGRMFSGCSSLTNLDVSKWNTRNVNDMGAMFYGCSNLANLDVSNWNTSNVAGMGVMFHGCSKLSNLDVSKWDTSSLTDMGGIFSYCSSLVNLDMSNWNISNVTNMNGAFYGCSSLSRVGDVSKWNTSNVTNMAAMFAKCPSLDNLDVSNWNTSKVTTMSWMFQDCSSLTNLNVSKWDTGNVTNMSGMFRGCSKLPNLDVSNWNTSQVTDMSWMFQDCSNFTNLNVSNWNTSKVTSMAGIFRSCSKLANLDVSKWNTSQVTDMHELFNACPNLVSVGDLSNWDTSKVTNMAGMFYCPNLVSVGNLSNWNISKATDISGMFFGCSSLTNLDVSKWDTRNATNIGGIFANCSSLSNLDVSRWNTSNVTNMSWAFYGDSNLTNLDVSNWDTGKVTNSDDMFYGVTKLQSLTLGSKFNINSTNTGLSDNFDQRDPNLYPNWVRTSDDMIKSSSDLMTMNASSRAGTWEARKSNVYAVYNNGTLTFIQSTDTPILNTDNISVKSTNGNTYTGKIYEADGSWNSLNSQIKTVDLTTKVTPLSTHDWFDGCTNLTSVNNAQLFDMSHNTDMSWMFQNCQNLTNLDVSNWDTSKVATMSWMFQNCSSLTNLDVSKWDTSNATNMAGVFSYCSNLTNLDVSNWDTSKVTNMKWMFQNCSSLTNLDVSKWDTGNVTNMVGIFAHCSSLTNLDVSKWDTSKVTKMGGIFGYCSNLTNLDVSKWDTGNATSMAWMFSGCSSLTNLDVSNWNTSKVTDMNWMFQNCQNLTNLDVSKWDINKVTDMGWMFQNCSSLTNLDVSKWDTSKATNVSGMFSNCSSLANLDVSKWDTSNVANMSWMFQNCQNLTNLDLSNWDTSKVTTSDSIFSGTTKLESLTLGSKFNINSTNTGLTDNFDQRDPSLYPKWVRISDDMIKSSNELMTMNANDRVGTWEARKSHVYAVYNNGTLTFIQTTDTPTLNTDNISVKSTNGNTYTGRIYEADGSWNSLNSQIKTVDLTTKVAPLRTGNWFAGCTNLTSVNNAQLFDMSNNTDMYGMFYGCSNLINLDVSNWDTSKVTDMAGMFYGCSSLTNLDVSKWNTSNATTMNGMFYDCQSLTNLDVSKWDTGNVTNMREMFRECSNLSNLDVSNFDTSKVTDISVMFQDCSSLTNLDLSKWDTSKVTNMNSMFLGCTGLANLDVSKWDTSQVTDMNSMFSSCASLTNLDVSKWDTGNVTNMSWMFDDCDNLTNLDVSKWDTGNVTNMGFMFDDCSSLTDLDVSNWNTNKVTAIDWIFGGCSNLASVGDLSKWDTSKVTNMIGVFGGCSSLTNLDVSKWDTNNVTDMDNMFQNCQSLTNLDVSKWDTSQVTDMNSMFQNCQSLTNLDVSNWDTSKVTNSDYMFTGTTKLQSLTLGSKFNINSTSTGLADDFNQRDPSLYSKWVRTSDDMVKSSNDLMTMDASARVGTWTAKKMIATIDVTDSNKKTVLESGTLDNYKTIVDKWAHRGYTVGTSNVPPALDPYAPSYKMTYTVYMNPNVSTYSVTTTTPKGTYMFKDGKQVGTKTVNLMIIMNGGAYFTSNKMSNVINQVMSQTPAGWNVESTKYTITDGYGNNQTTPQGGYTVVYSVEFAVDQDKVTKNYGEFAPVLPADHDSYDAISGSSIKITLPDVYTVTSLATRTSPVQDTVYAFYKLTSVRTGNNSALGNLTFTDGKTGGYGLLDGESSGNYVTAHMPIDWSNANNAGSYKWYESHMSFEYVNNYDNPDMAVVDTDNHMFDVTWYKHNPILFDDTNPSEQQVPYCQLNILGNDGKSFDTIMLHNTYSFLQNSQNSGDYLTAKAGYGIEYPYQVMQQFYDESSNANNQEPSGYATTSNLYDNTLTSDINHEELRFYTSSKQLHDVPANTSNEFAQLNAQYGSVFYPMQFQTLTNITARSKLLRNGFQAYADEGYDNKSSFNSPSNAVSSMMLGNNRYDPDHRHCDYIKDNVKEGIYPLNINANIGEVTVNKNFKIQIYGSRMASKDSSDGEISIDGTLSGTTSNTADNLKNQHGITDEEAEQLKDFLKN